MRLKPRATFFPDTLYSKRKHILDCDEVTIKIRSNFDDMSPSNSPSKSFCGEGSLLLLLTGNEDFHYIELAFRRCLQK